MYFTFLVFIVGLAASLKWRYKDQLVSGFVRNNLPAVGNPSNQLTWETFEHIGSKELTPQQRGPLSLLVDSPFVERIDIYNDSLIIKPRTPWEKLKGQRYIGFYTPSPSPHAQSALNISSATPNLSNLPLGGEASRQLGPSYVGRLGPPLRTGSRICGIFDFGSYPSSLAPLARDARPRITGPGLTGFTGVWHSIGQGRRFNRRAIFRLSHSSSHS